MVNLVYDISVLGLGHSNSIARTGVFRVVEHVALGMNNVRGCNMIMCTGIGNVSECREYLLSQSQLQSYLQTFVDDLGQLKCSSGSLLSRVKKLLRMERSARTIYHSSFFPIPDVVHQNSNFAKVQTIHDLIPIQFPQLCADGVSQLISKVINAVSDECFVICNSESTRNDLCNHNKNIDPAKVFVTYLAASEIFYRCADSLKLLRVRKQCNIPECMKYLLSVCTLEPRKNIVLVIRSFLHLVQEYKLVDLYLVLTGVKGWHFDKILEEVDNADAIRSRIILTGYLPDEDLAPLYSGALAFVYPSLYEGFGLPPLEAMQCGIPVITSNTSSLPEVVGDAGIMVDPMDGEALCQAMFDLYSDEALRSELAARSLQQAAKFSWKRCVQETFAVYQKASAG